MDSLVAIARPSSPSRCAFCHDALGVEWDVCSGCNTRLHPECRVHAVECPTLGCRESVLRERWASPRGRPRPAFRRALARITARQSVVTLEDRISVRELAAESSWPTVALLGHAVLSPLVLAAFTAYFTLGFVPAYWAATLVRRRGLSDRVRDRLRGPASVFSFEAATAPFAVLTAMGVELSVLAAILEPSVAAAAFLAALAILLPPALGWNDASAG